MKQVYSSEEMRSSEQAFFASGASSLALMERAAEGLAEKLWEMLRERGKTCVFACGPGGNGGDGYAAARIFTERGGRAIVLPVLPPKTADAITNSNRARETVFSFADIQKLDELPRPDAWCDCIFGIGVTRAPEGDCARVIDRMNADRERGSVILSADIPSGLCADTGLVFGKCVHAHATVTFEAYKRGHFLGRGMEFCGQVTVFPLGIARSCLPASPARLTEREDVKKALSVRPRAAYKNQFGHLLVFAGSSGMAGAAVLCAQSAMRSGAGLVTVACPVSIVPIVQTLAPCAMALPLPETQGAANAEAAPLLASALRGKTAIAAGPGLSVRAHPECLKVLMKSHLPAVWDADALNILSENRALLSLFTKSHVITPHPGEAARLLGKPCADAVSCARELHSLGVYVLLKGAASVIYGEEITFSASGCEGMAKGGSGDTLTGIVGAFLAQGVKPETALWLASEIHGIAGEIAQERFGAYSMLPSDLVDCLGAAFARVQSDGV